jgi:hypothetical protein
LEKIVRGEIGEDSFVMDVSDVEIIEDSISRLEADLTCGEDAAEEGCEFIVERLEF